MAKIFLLGILFCSIFSCKFNSSKINSQSDNDSVEYVKQQELRDSNFIKDSVEYVKQCVEFIKQVKQKELSYPHFILKDKPLSLENFDCINTILKDTTTFTKEELEFIKNKNFISISKWTKEMFPKIKIISSDTVDKIFKTLGWDYFYNCPVSPRC